MLLKISETLDSESYKLPILGIVGQLSSRQFEKGEILIRKGVLTMLFKNINSSSAKIKMYVYWILSNLVLNFEMEIYKQPGILEMTIQNFKTDPNLDVKYESCLFLSNFVLAVNNKVNIASIVQECSIF